MRKILLFILPIVLVSCTNDFDINGEYEDHTVVYGLLNAYAETHYIKVTKSFLGDKSAYEMAQEADSLYYDDNLVVYMDEFKLEVDYFTNTEEWVFLRRIAYARTTANEIPKDSLSFDGGEGVFSTEKNYLYKANATISGGRKYRLVVHVPGKDSIWSEAMSPVKAGIKTPVTPYLFLTDDELEYSWRPVLNGYLYQPILHFRVQETLNGKIDTNVVDLAFSEKQISSSSGVQKIQLGGEAFFEKVAGKIDVVEGVEREAIDLYIVMYIAGEDFAMYREVSSASSGFNQTKGEYTNIVNGHGLFDFVSKTASGKLEPDRLTKAMLHNHELTKDLGFVEVNLK
jgi:hypothetical protein